MQVARSTTSETRSPLRTALMEIRAMTLKTKASKTVANMKQTKGPRNVQTSPPSSLPTRWSETPPLALDRSIHIHSSSTQHPRPASHPSSFAHGSTTRLPPSTATAQPPPLAFLSRSPVSVFVGPNSSPPAFKPRPTSIEPPTTLQTMNALHRRRSVRVSLDAGKQSFTYSQTPVQA